MHLERKIEKYLQNWILREKGLLIKGQRQVGKTYIIKNQILTCFKNTIEINLITNKEMCRLLSTCKNKTDFLDRLHLYYSFDENDKNTIIFIDELQESYRYQYNLNFNEYIDILTLSKEIITNNGIRMVFSGSLLGIEIFDTLKNIDSNPMGYVDIVEMFPLDFEEFLLANGINSQIIEKLEQCFNKKIPVDNEVNTRMMKLFSEYLLIGGMPEAIVSFIKKRNFFELNNIHEQLNNYILLDISKYANIDNKLKIKEIYKILPTELNSQSKRFNLNDIESFKKDFDLTLSFSWLTNAGVAIPVYNAKDLKLPLSINTDRMLLKLFHADVGLLTHLYFDTQIKEKLLLGDLNINKGAIVENFVAQTLHCHGFNDIYYYNKKSTGELDFIISMKSKIIPIEIKSGKDYKRHSALTKILSSTEYNIEEAYVFANSNIETKEKITYFPIYMTCFLCKLN